MIDYQQRVLEEKWALDDKIEKLDTFIYGGKSVFANLALNERTDLVDQLGAMRLYSRILGIRIKGFTDK